MTLAKLGVMLVVFYNGPEAEGREAFKKFTDLGSKRLTTESSYSTNAIYR